MHLNLSPGLFDERGLGCRFYVTNSTYVLYLECKRAAPPIDLVGSSKLTSSFPLSTPTGLSTSSYNNTDRSRARLSPSAAFEHSILISAAATNNSLVPATFPPKRKHPKTGLLISSGYMQSYTTRRSENSRRYRDRLSPKRIHENMYRPSRPYTLSNPILSALMLIQHSKAKNRSRNQKRHNQQTRKMKRH